MTAERSAGPEDNTVTRHGKPLGLHPQGRGRSCFPETHSLLRGEGLQGKAEAAGREGAAAGDVSLSGGAQDRVW